MDTNYLRIVTEDLFGNPAFVPTANPADVPAINAIANGEFSEKPQKVSLNLHGDPCMAAGLSSQGRLRAISALQQRAD
jgi:hypothetical protein